MTWDWCDGRPNSIKAERNVADLEFPDPPCPVCGREESADHVTWQGLPMVLDEEICARCLGDRVRAGQARELDRALASHPGTPDLRGRMLGHDDEPARTAST